MTYNLGVGYLLLYTYKHLVDVYIDHPILIILTLRIEDQCVMRISLSELVQYEFSHNRVQYCKCDKISEQSVVLIIYIGRKCF